MLERRSRLTPRKSRAIAVSAAIFAGAFGFWLDRGLTGDGWSPPLTALLAGAVAWAIGEWIMSWLEHACASITSRSRKLASLATQIRKSSR